jgi:hypothetical protein
MKARRPRRTMKFWNPARAAGEVQEGAEEEMMNAE